jgi:hypothetical protein
MSCGTNESIIACSKDLVLAEQIRSIKFFGKQDRCGDRGDQQRKENCSIWMRLPERVSEGAMLVEAAGPKRLVPAYYGLFWREVFRKSKMMVSQTMCGDCETTGDENKPSIETMGVCTPG